MNLRRFRPVAYSLSEKGLEFPLQQTRTVANESRDNQISMWGLLKELEGKKFQIVDQLTQLIVTTESETRTVRARSWFIAIANLLLESWQAGIKPLELTWFWLETRHFDAGISHTFFVVDEVKDRIVCEEMKLVEGPEDHLTFDRGVLDADNNSRTSGLAPYWYGRFYRETKLGKLCMLASGWRKPKVFYHSDRLRSDLRVIRFLLVAILVCLMVLVLRR